MFVIYLLCVFISVESRKIIYITDGESSIQRIGGRLYKEEVLTDKFNGPKELAYDSSSRNLFFMYMDDVLQNSGRAYVNIVTKKADKVNGIARNRATAVDTDTSDVYFGSDNGLYKYDSLLNVATNIGLYNVNILKLVIRDNKMYLIDAHNHMLYKVFNEGASLIKLGEWKTVMEFEVDNSRNIHLVTMCGVYCAVGGHETIKNKDLSVVYHFLIDGDKTYGVTEGSIYELDCKNGTATKLTDINFFPSSIILGDYGEIFYSKEDTIYRLRPISSYLVYNMHNNTTGS